MKKLIFLTFIFVAQYSSAFVCTADLNNLNPIELGINEESFMTITINNHQFNVITIKQRLELNIFSRRNPSESARALVSIPKDNDVIALQLETKDGFYNLNCK